MAVRITTGPRGSGKTTRLIEMSAQTGYTIIEPTAWMVDVVKEMAKARGLKIPEPISIDQIVSYGRRREILDGQHRVLIDELDMCLQLMGLEVVEATMRDDYRWAGGDENV